MAASTQNLLNIDTKKGPIYLVGDRREHLKDRRSTYLRLCSYTMCAKTDMEWWRRFQAVTNLFGLTRVQ